MMNPPLISVIVPCYNQAIYLDECLSSVLDQTYNNWECIIVDDGSPDKTKEKVLDWNKKDSRFIYLSKTNGGLSSARNAGIREANGLYILPLDADDKIAFNYLEETLKEIQLTGTKLVYGNAEYFGEKTGPWILPSYNYKKLLDENMIFCCALFRKSDWQIIDGYDEKILFGLEDWEFWIRLLNKDEDAIKISSTTFYYRIKNNSMIKDLKSDNDKNYQIMKYIFDKHINKFVTSSVFDLYQENVILKSKIANPLTYLGCKTLILLLFKCIKKKLSFKIKIHCNLIKIIFLIP